MQSHTHPTPHETPVVQGIKLVSTQQLPDRLSSIFTFPLFNAVQSKCFKRIYKSDDNFVLSAPTGSGKTAVLELAICRLVSQCREQQFKVVYQAPTKSLCAERQKDWQAKFSHLGLKCGELTGDTEHNQLRHVQTADILVTTPEKWDSMTRKWKDHRKLMELIKLFLIDEVHILKEDRGASLEAIVSRMKSVGSDVRFIALSATVPNSDDIALWLGRNNRIPGLSAAREVFGEDFRPVRLQKHVVGIQANGGNDFAFDQVLNNFNSLPEVISSYSTEQKPIMIFCMTRKSTEVTAKLLAQWRAESPPQEQLWKATSKQRGVRDGALCDCMNAGVAFHHAGLEQNDRTIVAQAYLSGDIHVICCTSTLAVGVNLPCHLVIIKNTVAYQAEGCKEYSDLEVMQMLGRAGRPQFDHSAVSVVMTRHEKVHHYEKMVSGQEILESKLHLNLIEHLNAEIGLGTIFDLPSAKTWLKGTFLFVRFRKNPNHYRLSNESSSSNIEEIFQRICTTTLDHLRQFSLIDGGHKIQSTEFGDAMARYYVQFETMKLFMGLQRKAKISEILSAIAQASEFKSIRFRSGEKQMFKEINTSPSIKFPIKVDLALGPHKVSLIIQAVLGGLDMRSDGHFANHSQQFLTESATIFQHVHRLIRCIIDCQIFIEDSVAARNALELSRSFGGRSWDDSPLQMMQVEKIGPAAARKLIGAGIQTVEDLAEVDSQRINMILSRNPPFGSNLLQDVRAFPRLRISLKMVGQPIVRTKSENPCVHIDVKAELGFLNENAPVYFRKNPINVVFLAETSDGRVVHFSRTSAQKLRNGQDVTFRVELQNPLQLITCYVSCDDIAGTQKYATMNPVIPASSFPATKWIKEPLSVLQPRHSNKVPSKTNRLEDNWSDGIDDSDLVAVATSPFEDIDDLEIPSPKNNRQSSRKFRSGSWQPSRLTNGNWACNHPCKDKTSCKHLCCREGLEKPPKPPKESKSNKSETELPKKKTSVHNFFPVVKQNTESTEPATAKPSSNISKRRIGSSSHKPLPRRQDSSSPTLHSVTLDLSRDFPEQLFASTPSSVGSCIARSEEVKGPSGSIAAQSMRENSSTDSVEKINLTGEDIDARVNWPTENKDPRGTKRFNEQDTYRPGKMQKRFEAVLSQSIQEQRLLMAETGMGTSATTPSAHQLYDGFTDNDEGPATDFERRSHGLPRPDHSESNSCDSHGQLGGSPGYGTASRQVCDGNRLLDTRPRHGPTPTDSIHVISTERLYPSSYNSHELLYGDSVQFSRKVGNMTPDMEGFAINESPGVLENDNIRMPQSILCSLENSTSGHPAINTEAPQHHNDSELGVEAKQKEHLKEVDAWLLEQFGDIVEFV